MPVIEEIAMKIVLLGDPSVGKTSLIKKFVLDIFHDQYLSTLGTKVTTKKLLFPDQSKEAKIELTLVIWDVMGQKEYKLIHQSAYNGAKGAIIACDMTREETVNNLNSWVTSLFTGNVPIIFVGNKIDLTDQIKVNDKDLSDISISYETSYYKTSAKTGENVEKIFNELGNEMINKYIFI